MTPPPLLAPAPARLLDVVDDGADRLIAGLRSERRVADEQRRSQLMGGLLGGLAAH